MLTINQIITESLVIRFLLEKHKNDDLYCLTSDFPIANCRLASYLLAYHILNVNPNEVIYGVNGFAKNKQKEETISHHWLEIGNLAVDITADQYNYLEDRELNNRIIKLRPFKPVYVDLIGNIPNYKIFRIDTRDRYLHGFPDFSEDYLEKMSITYKKIMPKIK